MQEKKKDTDISVYQIYLPKLHENILKYYKLKLFREITGGILVV